MQFILFLFNQINVRFFSRQLCVCVCFCITQEKPSLPSGCKKKMPPGMFVLLEKVLIVMTGEKSCDIELTASNSILFSLYFARKFLVLTFLGPFLCFLSFTLATWKNASPAWQCKAKPPEHWISLSGILQGRLSTQVQLVESCHFSLIPWKRFEKKWWA